MSADSGRDRSSDRESEFVPLGVRIAAGWSWRVIIIVAAVALIVWTVVQIRLVVIPVVVAVLFASLLRPLVLWLRRHGMHLWLAVALVELGFLAIVAGLFWTIATQLSRGLNGLIEHSENAYRELKTFLLDSPLHITEDDINNYLGGLWHSAQQDSHAIVSGALSVGTTAGHIATGVLLVLFSLIFFLADGRTIFFWAMRLVPTRVRAAVSGAGHAGWRTLSSYVRVQILVAACDAVGIGIGAAILGLPMVVPLSILVFMGSFVPFVGAIVSGILVCVVALVYKGWIIAFIMLAVVIAVQQLESHVMQPLIMGNAVKVHPLGVVLSVAIGTMLAGIPGALFAVPFVAVTNRIVNYFGDRDWETDLFAQGVQLTIDDNSGRSSFTGPHAAKKDAAVVAAAVANGLSDGASVAADAHDAGTSNEDGPADENGDGPRITKG
ncbi:AI-2E family transporter [Pseudoclavibacter sp. CFCC 13611]|uniref:AI-2E family transporter n=1 Tax=Pseudoclavibacter sp. CFCC 13611 TaxID=2615178 RepID=UPI0013019173|nr:AI-2E family transporter [Pseudoclavibacter sp. CFCC 13611]KAB1663087.1 AI-2E family transporter [Pseudoclavibacter sp. CFCC 13611]